jgi:acyl carrier protein
MKTEEDVLAVIRTELRQIGKSCNGLERETVLAELNITSMEVLTIILTIKRKYGLDLSAVIQSGMPVTVGDLEKLLRTGSRAI